VITLVHGDITTLTVDAIVNAANERMLGGGGVDGAIHRAQARAVRGVPRGSGVRPGVRCPTGQSRITPGFQLSARYVIHTVGPIWRGGDRGEAKLLASCYRTSLELARQHQARSIAFPAISCGVYGYPIDEAAAIAVREVRHTKPFRSHQSRRVRTRRSRHPCRVPVTTPLTTRLALTHPIIQAPMAGGGDTPALSRPSARQAHSGRSAPPI
jgi:O-acetyl-ADP-ribose deacetylase (regulator of RNase III)